jgi:hypothetical protein
VNDAVVVMMDFFHLFSGGGVSDVTGFIANNFSV